MATISHPPVSLIIPNFNGAHLLPANLPVVLRAAETYGPCTVIVVDDASSDDSLKILETFPAIRVVRHGVNRGFAEAIHSGVAVAETELLIFLNSDVQPQADFIAPLLAHLQRPDVFSVSPLVTDENGKISGISWRCCEVRRGRLRTRRWQPERTPLGAPCKSLFASGGSVALRKSRFLELEGFLPIFKPFYSEDFDLGIRGWRRGWETLVEPESRIVHTSQEGSIKRHIPLARVRRVRIRNRLLLEWIHVPRNDLLLQLLPGYVRQLLGRLLRLDFDYLAGLGAALARLPEALRARRSVAATAVRPFWAVMDEIQQDFTRAPR